MKKNSLSFSFLFLQKGVAHQFSKVARSVSFCFSMFIGITSVFGQLQGTPENNLAARWSSSGLYGKYTQAQELPNKRTRFSKTFKNSDGTNTIIFGGLTHYKDANGNWQEVDYSIGQNTSANHSNTHSFSNQSHEIKSYYPSTAGSNGVIISNGLKELNWWQNPSVQVKNASGNTIIQRNANTNSASTSNNNISYQTYPGVTDQFVVEEKGIENNIIISSFDSLKNNSASVLSFSQFVPIPAGFSVYMNGNATTSDFTAKTFAIKQSLSDEGFVFNPIIVFDNGIATKEQAMELLHDSVSRLTSTQVSLLNNSILKGNYRVSFVSGGINVQYVFPYNWFASANRNFPITIDPVVTVGNGNNYTNLPWDLYYADTREQCLFLASELTTAGLNNGSTITAIGINAYSGCATNYTGLKIRLKNTASTSFGSGTFDNSGYTNCFSGSQNVQTTGWYTNTFSTNYTFSSSSNIIMDFSMNNTTWSCATTHTNWLVWNASNRGIYSLNVNDIGDPQTLSSGTLYSYIPYIQITYTSCTAPAITAQPSNATICAGGSANFSVTASGTTPSYQWQYWNGSSYVNVANGTPSGATYSNAMTATVTVSGITSAATYTYNCYVSNGCGNVTTNSKTLTVNSNPTVSVSPSSTTFCNGASATLTASGASTYAWSPSTGLNTTTGATVTASPTATTTYTVTGTNSNGCTGTKTISVTVNPLPSLTVTPSSASLCLGSSTSLTVSGANTYAWSPSTGLNNTTGATVTANPTTTTTYTVTGTNSSGCVNNKSAVVTINAIPSVSVTPTNPTVCTGGNATLTASGATTYAWSPSTALNTTTGATVISSPTANITYTVTGTTSGCSGTATSSVSFQSIAGGTASASGGSDVCSNSAVSLSLSGQVGTFVKWQSSTDNITYTDIPGGTTQNFSTSVNTSTYFRAQITNGSCPAVYSASAHYLTNNNYYVNDNSTSGDVFTTAVGNSGNDGRSPASPKTSINSIFSTYAVGPCDTIFVDKGTYSEETDIFSGDGGDSHGYATVIGAGVNNTVLNAPANSHNFYLGTNYMKIQDVAMSNTNLSYYNVELYEAAHNIITGTKLTHTADANIVVFGDAINSNGNQILNNTITNSSSAIGSGIYNGIFVEGNCDLLTVQSNTVTMSGANTNDAILITTYNDGFNNYYPSAGTINQNTISAYTYGVSLYGYNYPIATYTVSNNSISMQSNATSDGGPIWLGGVGASSADQSIIYDNRLSGGKNGIYFAFSVNYSKTYNNYISGSDYGIQVAATSSNNNELYFNSFYNTTNNLFYYSTSCSNWNVKNNILYNTSSSSSNACINLGSSSTFAACDYNLFYNPSGASTGRISTTNYSTLTAWKAVDHASGAPLGDEHSQSGNPLYSNAGVNNLDITSSSPASVSGTTISGIITDIYNHVRTSPPSIGADDVPPMPTITAVPSLTICSGSSETLTANVGGGTGQTYVWSPGGATTSAITVNPTATTNYSVQVNYSGGFSAVATKMVTVNPLPTPTVTANPSFTICNGQNTTLTASGGTSYSWNTGTTTSTLTLAPTTTTSYTLTVTNANGCIATATKTVMVNTLPTPTITASPSSTICSGISLTLSGSGASTYVWNPGGATTASVNVSPTANSTYTLTGTSSSGCSASVTQSVTINPAPAVSISGADSLCVGQSTMLIASGGNTYSWSTSETTSAITVSPASTTTYSVTATNSFGCTAAVSHAVVINLACNTNYRSGFSGGNPPPIDPAFEVGTTPGNFSVSQSGAATYDIPLFIPPGTAGVAPHLSLSYNSMGGDGLMGIGWSLSGLSSISRTAQSVYYNGIGHTAPVTLTNSDNFVLDGSHLIPTSGNNGDDGTIYGAEMETFVRITSHGQVGPPLNSCPAYFTAETKDGTTLEYGFYPDSYIQASGNLSNPALTWLLDKVTDSRGNYIRISYFEDNTTGEFRPDHIDYTGTSNFLPYNQVKFVYNARTDKQIAYEAGHQLQQNVLLASVEMMALGNKAHEYDFNYSYDMASHLSEVIEKGSDGKKFNSTKFVWDNTTITDLKPIHYTQPIVHGAVPSYAPDVNGDGYSDNLNYDAGGGYHLYPNNFISTGDLSNCFNSTASTGTFPNGSFIASYNGAVGLNNLGAVDLNGDGYDDMIVYNSSYDQQTYPFTLQSQSFNYYLSNGANGNLILQPTLIAPNGDTYYAGSCIAYTMGDFDGDGTSDLFIYYSGVHKWYAYSFKTSTPVLLGTGSVGAAWENISGGQNLSSPQQFINIFPIDIDGDGKEEIAVQGMNGNVNGNLFVNALTSSGTLSQLFINNCSSDINDAVFPADFNGDGKTDLLVWNYNANTPQTAWKISYSTGTSTGTPFFTSPTPIASLGDYSNSTFGNQLSQINLHQVFVADFNGDGKADIVEKTANWNGDPNVANGDLGTDLHTLYGTGSGFIEDNTHFNETYPSAQFANNIHPAISIGDFNGDGHLDLRYRDGNPSQGPVIFTFLENKNIHKVHKIFNGLGAAINVDYNTLPLLAKAGQYTKDNQAAFPVEDFQKALTVVADTKQDNGISGTNEVDYNYSGAKIHLQGKGFLGFNTVASTDVATNMSAQTEYSLPNNTHFFQRTVSNTKTFLTSPHVDINEKIYSYNFVPGSNLPLGDPSGLRYYFFASGISDNDQLHGNIITSTSIQQDQSGNVTSQTTNNPAVSSVTTNTYEQKGAWLTSRILTSSTITSRGNTSYTRSAQMVNDYSGRPVLIIKDAGVGTTTSINYDFYGNVLTTTVSGSDITSRTTTNTYDTKGRFAITSANALNHTLSAVYDDAYGNPISKTDANGLTMQYVYDGFGRIKQTVTPTSQQINITHTWDNSFSNCVYFDEATETGTPTSRKYYDKLGRMLHTQTTGFAGTDIKADREYNSIGQLFKESEPYLTSASVFTQYSYDNLLRPLGISSASGATTSYNYTPNTTITDITTTQGSIVKTQRKILDESGLLTSSQDNGGTVTYSYHSNGKPLSITSPLGSTITMQYDNLGRQTKLVDPDAGEMDYEYNSLGELTKQTDAKGNIFNLNYDLLGRTTSQIGSDNSAITYQYDGSQKGMIDKITGSTILYNNISCEYSYDNFSRMLSKKEKIDGTDYTTSYAYDNLSRVIQETYPGSGTPFATKMSYNAYGYLEKILKASDNSLIWQCNAMTERMQVMQATSGNGLVQTKTYTSLGLLQNAVVKNGSTPVWNIDYNFDAPSHNLVSRSNVLIGLNETFSYDNVDRLTSVSLNGNPTLNMFYDQSGNINGKSDVGNYNYTGSQPHAVAAITDPMPNVPTVQQNIVYTTFNKAATITEGNYQAEILYGPDYARKKMQTKDIPTGNILGTKYYLGNYEKSVNAAGDTRELNYISGADGLSAIYVKNITNSIETDSMYYIHTDHLGSIALISSVNQNNNPVVLQEISYDAWGRRRDAATWTISGTSVHYYFDRGFTGHEHLDVFGLINMNGRMYDPLLGRMLSPDNFVQAAGFSQSFNRFSYCINNPLKYFDLTGYNWWTDFTGWVQNNWKPIVTTVAVVAVAVVVTVATAGLGTIAAAVIAGAAAGATGGILSTALSGGSLSQTLWAGVGGAVGGAAFGVLGGFAAVAAPAGALYGALYGAGTGGFLGGLYSKANGGSFWKGAAWGAALGAAGGAYNGYYQAQTLGRNPWTGARIPFDNSSTTTVIDPYTNQNSTPVDQGNNTTGTIGESEGSVSSELQNPNINLTRQDPETGVFEQMDIQGQYNEQLSIHTDFTVTNKTASEVFDFLNQRGNAVPFSNGGGYYLNTQNGVTINYYYQDASYGNPAIQFMSGGDTFLKLRFLH